MACYKCQFPDCGGPGQPHVLVQFNEDQCINGRTFPKGSQWTMNTALHSAHSGGERSNGGAAKRTVLNSNA